MGPAAMSFHGKKYLICGGAGFIGSAFTRRLVQLGANVTVLDPCIPKTGGHERHLLDSLKDIEWIRESVISFPRLNNLTARQDGVIDAMGFTSHFEGMKEPGFDLECNYVSHLALMSALERQALPVLYLGSRSQYGKLAQFVTEDYRQEPVDVQGIHKAAAESLFRIFAQRFGFHCISLRIGNCFGKGQPLTGSDIGLIGCFIRDTLENKNICLYGTPDRTRNLIYVEDVVDNSLKLFTQRWSHEYESYNLAGPAIRLSEVVKIIIDLAGQGSYTFAPFDADTARLDPGSSVISDNKLEKCLNGLVFTPFRNAIAATISYFKEKQNL